MFKKVLEWLNTKNKSHKKPLKSIEKQKLKETKMNNGSILVSMKRNLKIIIKKFNQVISNIKYKVSKMNFEKLKKKPLIFISFLVILDIVGTTLAYYYSETVIPNQFKVLTYDVVVKEKYNNSWGVKEVEFSNNEETNTPVVLRINYNESWRKEVSGIKLSLDNNVNGQNVVEKNWTTAFTDDFIDGEDGWYYYKKVLNAEESVKVLNSIQLNENLISTSPYYDDYKTYDYELDFNFEAIQANTTAISQIWGKTAVISGGKVRWRL